MPNDHAQGVDNPDRLAALRGLELLNSVDDPAFDRFTRLAARLLGVPVALISLIEADRQVFLSRVLPAPLAEVRETPLGYSFCQHTLATQQPLILPDVRQHPVVGDNLAIQEFGIAAYAGIPLVTADGHALGTLCVLDIQPHDWTPEDVATLHDLTAAVLTEIELRAALRAEAHARREQAATLMSLERLVSERTATLHATVAQLESEIAEREDMEKRLTHQAFHDALTGLPNRAWLQTQQTRQPGAILLIDLDRFKSINDTLGHDTGERLIIALGVRLQQVVRASDPLIHLGGDEFAILLTESVGIAEACALAERLLAALLRPLVIEERALTASASIGIALRQDASGSVDQLLRLADIALYRAKHAGGGCYRVFSQGKDNPAIARRILERELHGAVERGELHLHYQPKVDLHTGAIFALEALVRWQHPVRGPIPRAISSPWPKKPGSSCRSAAEYSPKPAARYAFGRRAIPAAPPRSSPSTSRGGSSSTPICSPT